MGNEKRLAASPQVAAAAVAVAGGRVLLELRRGGDGGGKWAFPGGRTEEGETPEDTAVRELREETGIRGTVLGQLGWKNTEAGPGGWWLTLYVSVGIEPAAEPVVMEPAKCCDLRWFPFDALPSPLWDPVEEFVRRGAWSALPDVLAGAVQGTGSSAAGDGTALR